MAHPIFHVLNGDSASPWLLTAEHAGNAWPEDLGDHKLPPEFFEDHQVYDLGMRELVTELAHRFGCTALLGVHTRLAVDLNREEADIDLIRVQSDEEWDYHVNRIDADARAYRIANYYRPYHDTLSGFLRPRARQIFVLSFHSFTPEFKTKTGREKRPWDVGLLYLADNPLTTHFRAGLAAVAKTHNLSVADNAPYDSKTSNGGLERIHKLGALGNGTPYLQFEFRNEWFRPLEKGVKFWADIIEPIMRSYAPAA